MPPRDLVGYGGDPPHARWLGDARIAVNFEEAIPRGLDLEEVLPDREGTKPGEHA